MTYKVGPGIVFQGDTTFSIENSAAQLSFESETGGCMHINEDGEVIACGGFTMDNGTYKLRLRPSSSMSADYELTYPSSAPNPRQTLKYDGGTLIWDNQSVDVMHQSVVRKNPATGEFGTIRDAVLYATGQTRGPNSRIVIYVYAGTYVESGNIVVPPYVHIVGESLEACIVEPSGAFDMFTMSNQTSLAFLNVQNVQSGHYGIIMEDVGDYALCHKVDVDDCECGILCKANTTDSICYFEYCSNNGCTVKSMQVESVGANACDVTIENHFFEPPCENHAIVIGENSKFSLHACVIHNDVTGGGIHVLGGEISARGLYVEKCVNGIHVDSAAVNPKCLLAGILFDECTQNLNIESDTCSGNFDGYSEYEKTYINPSSSFFITNSDNNIITVAKKGGNFTSVKAAIDSVTTATSTNVFYVYVGPGIYSEAPITMKPYVNVTGFVSAGTTISATTATSPLITMAGDSTIQFITLTGATGSGGSLVKYDGDASARTAYVTGVFLKDAETLVDLSSSAGVCFFNFRQNQIRSNAVFVNGITISTATVPLFAVIDGLNWSASSAPTSLVNFFYFISTSPGAVTNNVYLANALVGQRSFSASGSGMTVEGAVSISMTNCALAGYATAFSVPATTVTAPIITLQSINFLNNTTDISIQNTGTTGSINAAAERTKISIADSSGISITLRDQSDGSFVVSGDLYQGGDFTNIVNVTPAIQGSTAIGILTGGELTFGSGNTNIAAGTGYLLDDTDTLKYVTWSSQSITLPDGSNYIWIDKDGIVDYNSATPSMLRNILIGRVYHSSGNPLYVQRIAKYSSQLTSKHDTTFRIGLGVLFSSGCIATAGTSGLQVSVSSGSYFYSSLQYSPTAEADISMIAFYNSGSAFNTIAAIPLQYDNAGTLTAIPAGKWVKHMLFVVGDGSDQRYLFIYGQELFNLELDAQNGNLPTAPSFFTSNIAELCGIIVTNTDTGPLPDDRFRDIRNIRGANRISGSTASADHNSLLNLTTGNPHTQYVQKAGDTMSGVLNMGGNNISSAGTINGINLSTISTRLLPNGADPLATAIAVNISTANSAGVANSFSRSDHVHSHGNLAGGSLHSVASGVAAGFMSSADKNKLDAATTNATATTLALRDGSGNAKFRSLISVNAGNFTNTISTSTLQSTNLILVLPLTTGISGQVLSTDGAGNLSWSSAGSFSDPTNSIGDMIYRNESNVVDRLPVGTTGKHLVISGGIPVWREPIVPMRENIFYDDFNGVLAPFGDHPWQLDSDKNSVIAQDSPNKEPVYGCVRFTLTEADSVISISRNILAGLYFGEGTCYAEFEVFIETLADHSNQYILRLGFGDKLASTDDNENGIYIEYDISQSERWIAKTAAAKNYTTTETSTVKVGWTKLALSITPRSVLFNINGDEVANHETNIPNALTNKCSPSFRVARSGGSAMTFNFYIDYAYYRICLEADRHTYG